MNKAILIVEDEVLIAESIAKYLKTKKYEIAGNALSVPEAIALLKEQKIDLVLIDIRLSGDLTGINLAEYMIKHYPGVPFIYLTSQYDESTLEAARHTHPAGYLTKPIQRSSLWTTIEMVLVQPRIDRRIELSVGGKWRYVKIDDIVYIDSDHVYVRLHLKDGQEIVHRSTMKGILQQLSDPMFLQVHRSYIINTQYLKGRNSQELQVGGFVVPYSRNYFEPQ